MTLVRNIFLWKIIETYPWWGIFPIFHLFREIWRDIWGVLFIREKYSRSVSLEIIEKYRPALLQNLTAGTVVVGRLSLSPAGGLQAGWLGHDTIEPWEKDNHAPGRGGGAFESNYSYANPGRKKKALLKYKTWWIHPHLASLPSYCFFFFGGV